MVTPIPWKRIVAELGYRWTVGKARLRLQPGVRPLLFPAGALKKEELL